MKQIYHFSNQLGSLDCIPCPENNHSGRYSRDHIPTKALLNSPYPGEPHGRGNVPGV